MESTEWNDEIYEDIGAVDYSRVRVYSRDWTVNTILDQIVQGNIDLNPKFQRRNAWTDSKRSLLIESVLLGVPIPEIILAEIPEHKGAFIVIDGKQRLLTLKGFITPEIEYWDRARLTGLRTLQNLEGYSFRDLRQSDEYIRAFVNCDIRCTIISDYASHDVLYDIFYRLNTGSVPLSTQELRQAWNKGDFGDMLMVITGSHLPIHDVIGGKKIPDPRLRDVELLLRLMSIEAFGHTYSGNLKTFLDESMRVFTESWGDGYKLIEELMQVVIEGVRRLSLTLGSDAGRKFKGGKYERRFNKAVFEAQAYYFARVPEHLIDLATAARFREEFEALSDTGSPFLSAVESTTKTPASYLTRYQSVRDAVNRAFDLSITEIPIS